MSSAFLYLGIVLMWLCVLVPMWLRRDRHTVDISDLYGETEGSDGDTLSDVPVSEIPSSRAAIPAGDPADDDEITVELGATGNAGGSSMEAKAGPGTTTASLPGKSLPQEKDAPKAGAPSPAHEVSRTGGLSRINDSSLAGGPSRPNEVSRPGSPSRPNEVSRAGSPSRINDSSVAGGPPRQNDMGRAGGPPRQNDVFRAGGPTQGNDLSRAAASLRAQDPSEAQDPSRADASSPADDLPRANDPSQAECRRRARVMARRRRWLLWSVLLHLASVVTAAVGVAPWWSVAPSAVLLVSYLIVLRVAVAVDAEQRVAVARARAERERREREHQLALELAAQQAEAEIIEFRKRVEPFDQYAERSRRAVGD
jgi:hypothetical protein